MKGKSETLCCTHDAGWCRLGGANVWVTRVTALLFSDHIQHLPCPLPLPALATQTGSLITSASQRRMILRVLRLRSVEVCCKAVTSGCGELLGLSWGWKLQTMRPILISQQI